MQNYKDYFQNKAAQNPAFKQLLQQQRKDYETSCVALDKKRQIAIDARNDTYQRRVLKTIRRKALFAQEEEMQRERAIALQKMVNAKTVRLAGFASLQRQKTAHAQPKKQPEPAKTASPRRRAPSNRASVSPRSPKPRSKSPQRAVFGGEVSISQQANQKQVEKLEQLKQRRAAAVLREAERAKAEDAAWLAAFNARRGVTSK